MPSKRRVSQKKRVTRRREKKLSKKGGRRRTRKSLYKKKGGLSNSDKIKGFLTRIDTLLTQYISEKSADPQLYYSMSQQAESIADAIKLEYPDYQLLEPVIDTREIHLDSVAEKEISKRVLIQNLMESLNIAIKNLEIIIKKKEDDVAAGTSHIRFRAFRATFGIESGIVSTRQKWEEVFRKYQEASRK
jgi:hypothetical protein